MKIDWNWVISLFAADVKMTKRIRFQIQRILISKSKQMKIKKQQKQRHKHRTRVLIDKLTSRFIKESWSWKKVKNVNDMMIIADNEMIIEKSKDSHIKLIIWLMSTIDIRLSWVMLITQTIVEIHLMQLHFNYHDDLLFLFIMTCFYSSWHDKQYKRMKNRVVCLISFSCEIELRFFCM